MTAAPTVSRETVMTALLAKLRAAGDFKSVGRRNRNPDTIGAESTPALMLLEHSETYREAGARHPPVRRLLLRAVVYFDVGGDDNAIPSTLINGVLDRIDAIFRPDDLVGGQCTLGGLVKSAAIDGTITKAPGDITGKGLAIVPITILLP